MIDIVHSSSSWRDQKHILDYFDSVSAESAAVRFLQALDETIAFIAEFPDLGSQWDSSNPRHAGIRFSLVNGFENFVVVYRRFEDHVLIARIFHASQNIDEHLG